MKEDKINKLKSSVDNLRRELQMESSAEELNASKLERIQNTKRNLSALKIQCWYRKHRRKRSNRLTEMQQ